jgi:EamA domain-containing membrane protein RarD
MTSWYFLATTTVFRPFYLRVLNEEDATDILEHNAVRGFPGMVASVACIEDGSIVHWLGRECTKFILGEWIVVV